MGYYGLFLNKDDAKMLLARSPAIHENVVSSPHVTLVYNVNESERFTEMGQEFEIIIVGHGINNRNQGFSVRLPNSLKKYLNKDSKPHITISLSSEGKAFDTKKLAFKKITPFRVLSKFGFSDGINIRF